MLKQIGKFTISERIGRGTYSRVYRAVDPQGRPVAIKISTTPTEQDHLSDFQRDLVAAASVLHPNLVSVHDLGFEDEFPYIVMEFVEGRDLDKLLQAGAKVSLGERVRIMQQVGLALKSAHERGVFHLDVRPSKIMSGGHGTVKLLDLGLGRLSYDPSRITDRGYLIGSPFYMSPERLMAVDTANAQCDIWSFGVAFHEWIAGRHPFYDDDGDRMIGNIMDNRPEELAGVPGSLHRLILQAIDKDPGRRYRNFADLLADLKPILTELQREESDAMLAEALKQTDSGQWYEARRIARQMSEKEPAFGAQPLAEPRLSRSGNDSSGVAYAASPGFSTEPPARPEPPPVIPPPRPRPEPEPERTIPEPPPLPPPVLAPRPTVRILEAEESNGFPWGKVAAFAVAALLVAGVLFFLWGPYSSVVGKGELSAEAKAISPDKRLIKNPPIQPPTEAVAGAPAADDSNTSDEPKVFDPNSLSVPISVPASPPHRRSNVTAGLKAPPLGDISVADELAALPDMPNAPPPPAPASAVVKDSLAPSSTLTRSGPQSVEAAQAAAVRVGGSFSQPVLIHSVPPSYPLVALERKAQGVVRFEATIAKDGSVKNLQVVSGDPLLDAAAKKAVLQWKYRPALLNGEAIEVTQAIVVKFNLSQ